MTFRRFKAWVRLILTVVILLSATLVVVMNRNNRTDLWLFHHFEQVGVIWLLLITVVVTLVGFWIIKGVYRAYRDVRRPDEPQHG